MKKIDESIMYLYKSYLTNKAIKNFTPDYNSLKKGVLIDKKVKKSNNKLTENYIVDPNDIIIRIPKNIIEKNKFEHTIGNIVIENDTIKLIFTDLTTSNRISSSNNNNEKVLRNYLKQENITKCKFKYYLEKAGAVITHNKENVDINLSIDNLNKNSIIELLK